MNYVSTRNTQVKMSASEAIVQGLAKDGGLLTPEILPSITFEDIQKLCSMSYQERAAFVMKLFLDEFTNEELADYAEKAYSRFDTVEIAKTRVFADTENYLELWHGPTCAFKDMALQMLPYLLTSSLRKTGEENDICILVATSGDTGKAALEGFRDVDHTNIIVFYPNKGVSEIQQLQMVTQKGNNVKVCAVNGNFDDAQTGVKKLFTDAELNKTMNEHHKSFSSANSINWGRVLPQIVYYISSYCDLVNASKINIGDKVNFCVPTGNFGNILSGYISKKMGLPVNKLICASNQNNVLTDFITTGIYDKNRIFYNTMSPSMDILVSSNLERLLFFISDEDSAFVADCMNKLNTTGRYEVPENIKQIVQDNFIAGYTDDNMTAEAIMSVYKDQDYLIDPHTAVAVHVYKSYKASSGDQTQTVIVSTANPYKFCDNVLKSINIETPENIGVDIIDFMENKTNIPAPTPLKELKGLPIRFKEVVNKEEMINSVLSTLEA